MAFWVGVRGLYRFLVLALQAFPLLLRCFALHAREVIMAYAISKSSALRFVSKGAVDPAPESPF